MDIKSPVNGRVSTVNLVAGEQVQGGDELVVLESMKMLIPIAAPRSGTVNIVRVKPGDLVSNGDILVSLI
jgi:urea carboxylase